MSLVAWSKHPGAGVTLNRPTSPSIFLFSGRFVCVNGEEIPLVVPIGNR